MCQLCGCSEFIKQGKDAVLRRSVEIVNELSLTPENVDEYENTEIIAGLIAPFGSADDGVYKTAAWISDLHRDTGRIKRLEQYQAHVQAFNDIFSRLPAKGEPKHITTIYHQLEQFGHELDDADLAKMEPEIGRAIQAVNRVHNDMTKSTAKLKKRYGL